jgi:hypothetical protein
MEPENEQARALPSACVYSRCHSALGEESTHLRGCYAIVFVKKTLSRKMLALRQLVYRMDSSRGVRAQNDSACGFCLSH